MATNPRARRRERGVALVMMALMMTLIMGMSALAIDYGMITSAKAEAQRAMDAAALAGASAFDTTGAAVLPGGEAAPVLDDAAKADSARAMAVDYAKKNPVAHNTIVLNPDDVLVDPLTRRVTTTYTSPALRLWFGDKFRTDPIRVTATATAWADGDSVVRLVE